MNSTKWYILMHQLLAIVLTVCITFAACYFNKWGILFFLIIPGTCMGMEVISDSDKTESKKDKHAEDN